MAILTVKDLTKSFGSNEVLKGISFDIHAGEVLSVIGPSGSGKSTLLRCCTLLEKMDAGEIAYGDLTMAKTGENGRAVYSSGAVLQQIRRRFGLVFQNFNLFPHYSVLRNLTEAPVRVEKKPRQEAEENARALLKKVGLENKADAYPCELSGGQQQRVAIARALAPKPAVILADEPTGNLDGRSGEEVLALLHLSRRRFHQTLIMVTHDRQIAEGSDRIITLTDGRVGGDSEVSIP